MPLAELATALHRVNWDNPRQCAADTSAALRALADDRELLTGLVTSIGCDPGRLARCETNPLINRLVLAEDASGADRWQLRLHIFQDGRLELIPHDHKYPFAVHVLTGGYAQVWNRRTSGRQTGPFTSTDLAPGLVTLEHPGTAYLFSDSLVHQTCSADDLHVDAAPVVFVLGCALLVVHWDECPVDDPQFTAVGRRWAEKLGERLSEPRNAAVRGCRGDTEEGAELLHGEVGVVSEDDEKDPVSER